MGNIFRGLGIIQTILNFLTLKIMAYRCFMDVLGNYYYEFPSKN